MVKDIAKVTKHLPTGWQEEADAMTADALKAAIVEAESNLKQIADDEAGNEEYQNLRAAAKEAGAGYRDGKKAQRAKIAYALHCLEQKGAI